MTNIRQTPLYAQFMKAINWQVETIDGVQIYIKKFPLLSTVIKIQRPNKLPELKKLKQLMQKYHANSITVEPGVTFKFQISNFKLSTDPYIHTKSIIIDLKPTNAEIFNNFSEAKRRAVRRAQKLGVTVEVNQDIDSFITLKNKTAGLFLGFLTTRGVTRPLWKTFAPKQAGVVMASLPKEKNIAGILILIDGKTAYYWMAAATKIGKTHFAPTLCVWEALRFAKNKGCTQFDFEGVFDERFPKQSLSWRGFSKFKAGFGGISIFYPQAFVLMQKHI